MEIGSNLTLSYLKVCNKDSIGIEHLKFYVQRIHQETCRQNIEISKYILQ